MQHTTITITLFLAGRTLKRPQHLRITVLTADHDSPAQHSFIRVNLASALSGLSIVRKKSQLSSLASFVWQK